MVKGFSFRDSSAPGADRSIVTSGRPATSRASDLMMQVRGSLGSDSDSPRPREAFHLAKDSSSASIFLDYKTNTGINKGQRFSIPSSSAIDAIVMFDVLE